MITKLKKQIDPREVSISGRSKGEKGVFVLKTPKGTKGRVGLKKSVINKIV